MKNLLTDIDVLEISVVDKGASGDETDRPRIVIAKRAVSKMNAVHKMSDLGDFMMRLVEQKGTDLDRLASEAGIDRGTINQIMSGDIKRPPDERLSAIARVLGTSVASLKDKIPSGRLETGGEIRAGDMVAQSKGIHMTLEEAMAELAPEQQQAILAAIQEAAKPAAPMKMEGEETLPAPEPPKPEDEVAKALEGVSPEARELVIKAIESDGERVALSKRVKALEDEKETARFVDIAKSMDALPGMNTEQRALVLKAANKALDATTYAAIEKSMRDAAVVIAKSGLFEEYGSTGGDADANAQLSAIAKKLRDDNPELSASGSRMKAMELHPELYNEAKAG